MNKASFKFALRKLADHLRPTALTASAGLGVYMDKQGESLAAIMLLVSMVWAAIVGCAFLIEAVVGDAK